MKKIFRANSALLGFFASTLLIAGCESNPVNGYFASMPVSATTAAGGSQNTGDPSADPSSGPVTLPPPVVTGGIVGGHFDVDTATGNMPYPISGGEVTYHVHEYDKLNQTTTVDFFNIINAGGTKQAGKSFNQIQNTIPAGTRFYLTVLNASLNQGGIIELNSSVQSVMNYQNITQAMISSGVGQSAYVFGTPTVAGDVELSSLEMAFSSTDTADSMLVPTAPTNCVFPDVSGPSGQYRDGALVVQAISASSGELSASTGAAQENGGLLWEGIIYNHHMIVNPTTGAETDPEICF